MKSMPDNNNNNNNKKEQKETLTFSITLFNYKHDAYTRRNARIQRALSIYTGMNAFQTILCFPK